MGGGKLEGNLDLATNRLIVVLHFSGTFAAGVGITSESHNSTNHRRGIQPIKLSLSRRTISQLWFKVLRAQTCWNDEVAAILQSILDLGRRWSIVQTDVGRTQSIQTWSRSLWETMGLWVGLGAARNRAKSLFAVQTSEPPPLLHSRNLVIFFPAARLVFLKLSQGIDFVKMKRLQNDQKDFLILRLMFKITFDRVHLKKAGGVCHSFVINLLIWTSKH